MIKVVIFDIGGVTIKYPMYGIYNDVGKKFETSEREVRRSYHELDPLIERKKISEKEFWSRLAKKINIKNITSLKKTWLNSLKRHGPLNRKVVKIIKELKEKGYKVATISNVPTPHEKLHRKLGHYKFFDQVFLSTRLKMKKPSVQIYRYAIKKLAVKPEECIFIDDKLENIIGARKAGMKAVLFKDAFQLEKDLKKYL